MKFFILTFLMSACAFAGTCTIGENTAETTFSECREATAKEFLARYAELKKTNSDPYGIEIHSQFTTHRDEASPGNMFMKMTLAGKYVLSLTPPFINKTNCFARGDISQTGYGRSVWNGGKGQSYSSFNSSLVGCLNDVSRDHRLDFDNGKSVGNSLMIEFIGPVLDEESPHARTTINLFIS